MSEFVEECRREWKRLRVPKALADEMAGDLAADLREAEADGASEEEVLGSGASDARAFAAAWARERGLVRPRAEWRVRRPWLVALVALIVAVAAAGVAVFAVSDGSNAPRTIVTTNLAPSIPPGTFIGSAVEGARLLPSNTALVTGRRTILHDRPRVLTVTFANTSARIVAPAHFTIQIGKHTYRFTLLRMNPNTRVSEHITLPRDLPRKYAIHATTTPVPGETNTSNNRTTWRVTTP
jgi:hypothetical protein